jgi:hypothetical protein
MSLPDGSLQPYGLRLDELAPGRTATEIARPGRAITG